MSQQNYQVVGACAIFSLASPTGPSRQYLYRGAWVPGDVPAEEIEHNLSVGLITPVEDPYHTPVDGNGVETPLAVDTDEVGRPTSDEPKSDGGDGDESDAAAETEAKQAAARAKLPEGGSAPDGRASKDVWVEFAVAKGYDRAEVEKSSRDDIKALFKS